MTGDDKTAIVPAAPHTPAPRSALPTSTQLDDMARMCKILAGSDMVPRAFQGNASNVFVALLVARRMDEDPITLMQNMYVLHGKPSFTASYMIARANRSGRLRGGIHWTSEGTGADLVVTAHATTADTGQQIDAALSMATARAEGWTRNGKYKTMPQVMLRYRTASLLIRQYLPDVLLGYDIDDDSRAPSRTAARTVPAIELPTDDGPAGSWVGQLVPADAPAPAPPPSPPSAAAVSAFRAMVSDVFETVERAAEEDSTCGD